MLKHDVEVYNSNYACALRNIAIFYFRSDVYQLLTSLG
jgi:hypothetical protein